MFEYGVVSHVINIYLYIINILDNTVCTYCTNMHVRISVFDILGVLQSSPSNLSSQVHVNVLGSQAPLTQTGLQTGEWSKETISLCHYAQHPMAHVCVNCVRHM